MTGIKLLTVRCTSDFEYGFNELLNFYDWKCANNNNNSSYHI